jgi:mono/diheme cytochrome c family protein
MSKWPKRLLVAAVAVVLIVGAGASTVFMTTERKLGTVHDFAMSPIAVPTDAASLERGRHIASSLSSCVECHGADLGGKIFIDEAPIGLFVASNLTRGEGGVGDRYSDQELARAIRHGVRADGTPLLFMPSQVFQNLSDEDLGALVAYIRSVPAVDRTFPTSKVGPVGRALYLAGKFPLLPVELVAHERPARAAVASGLTPQYGQYLAEIGGCLDCHGPQLAGGAVAGAPPGTPPAPNLTPAGVLASWGEAEFVRAMRTGQRPDGTVINPFMPWPYIGQMTDEELGALWLYLETAEPVGR